jgi:nucleotide-binding universal stress UspA family protein
MSSGTLEGPVVGASAGSELTNAPTSEDVARALVAPLLVVTDGGRASAAALHVAGALAKRDDGLVEVLVVEQPLPVPATNGRGDGMTLGEGKPPERTALDRVRRQLCAILGARGWNFRVEFGRVGRTIANAAKGCGARLVVTGLRDDARHLLGSDTAIRVTSCARVPVLAVAASAQALPQRAVVAIDFSPASVSAAREVRDLLASPAILHLVHVRSALSPAPAGTNKWQSIYEADMSVHLGKLAKELSRAGLTVTGRTECGDTVESLLRFAKDVDADLIACGTHSFSALGQSTLGSVPTNLLRAAECSVLIAPSPIRPNE